MTAWVCARISLGLACGVLVTLVGVEWWGMRATVPALSRATRAVRWLAAALALISVGFAGYAGRAPVAYAARLALIAGIAILPGSRPRAAQTRPDGVAAALVALLLTAAGVVCGFERPTLEGALRPAAVAEMWIAAICGGLGARLGAEWMGAVAVRDWTGGREQSPIPYVELTALVGSGALLNLWQQGNVWDAGGVGSILAAAWLTWSAGRMAPARPLWLRAALGLVAGALCITAALR